MDRVRKLVETIYLTHNYVYSSVDLKGAKPYEEIKTYDKAEQKKLVEELFVVFSELSIKKAKNPGPYDSDNYTDYAPSLILPIIAGILRRNLNYTELEWADLCEKISDYRNKVKTLAPYYRDISRLPLTYFVKQLEYRVKKQPLSEEMKVYVKDLLVWDEFKGSIQKGYYGSDLNKVAAKLKLLVSDGKKNETFELKSEDIGTEVNEIVYSIKENRSEYNKVFNLSSEVSGSKPTEKFKKALNLSLELIGLSNFRKVVHDLLNVALTFPVAIETHTHEWGGEVHTSQSGTYLCSPSQNFIKGLVWACNRFSDKETISILSRLAEKCYSKIPNKGPAAASVGNACVNILGNMKGKDGLGALSRLKLKVRQNNVKSSIDKLLLEGAKKYNVSVEELKEMAVPNFGLENGGKIVAFDDYALDLSVAGSKIEQRWVKPDGNPMKSVPSKIKNTPALKNKLQVLRKELKELQKVFSAQRQRIDNQFILDRTWEFPSFQKYYLDHGLVSAIAAKLIWTFIKGKQKEDAVYIENEWRGLDNQTLAWIDDSTQVKLWHPVFASEETIVGWRRRIMELQWKQPIKQAYREIYLLTDAEVKTKTYSNRMAAHILKQHQFNSLAKIRDWKYSLMGWYDDGIHNTICSKYLPEHKITAQYWIDELPDDESYNDAGIWQYVATDQVKFCDEKEEVMDLVDVPKIIFSEIMRDVDLFVGVASVGNDPNWMDNNGERENYRNYWESYSFGDLTEIAKTRKEVLQGLLPRLKKIRDKARIEGKFLIVKGTVRTYKIHIGSGNILMEPNDQYLCIVPSRSADKSTSKLFIPFEGDRGLSIVLSKAFLLAEDNKIQDETILSQIH